LVLTRRRLSSILRYGLLLPVWKGVPPANERSPPGTTHAMKTEDPPARAAFITALNDAYLVPREDGYAIFWRTSGHDLCTVEDQVAEQALRSAGRAVRLGSWSGTIRGRRDEWTLWWARGLPWASTSDVADGDQTLRMIEHWRAAVAAAEARGQRWDRPVPSAAAPPAHGRTEPRLGIRGRVRMLDSLRGLLNRR
jgi:hypothetical protein